MFRRFVMLMTGPNRQDLDIIALGGNAILPAGGTGTFDDQVTVTRTAMREVTGLLAKGRRVVLTHGNGPIVGNIVIRNEAAKDLIAPMPLDVCGADSQGGIGYMIQRTLRNVLTRAGLEHEVVAIVTQVVVDPDDVAFEKPTKPIGPFYDEAEALRLAAERGWRVALDGRDRGYRRVVPSPQPQDVVEKNVIAQLIEGGTIVITLGGGGVPVFRGDGIYVGCEAVVDKDLSSSLLAVKLSAARLIILTDIDAVYRDFGTASQTALRDVTAAEVAALAGAGHFPAGSMGSKIQAALEFLAGGGDVVAICRPGELAAALDGKAGTVIHSGAGQT